ncbi:Cytochrome P450 [Actinokineospora sp. UTMC 2448]|nr:Cytochrome P450 [Actinokineospora sp. UTMC 2448]
MSILDDDVVVRLDEVFVQDPHSLYRELREAAPVRRVVLPGGLRGWLVTRYADVRAALADPTLSKDFAGVGELVERHAEEGAANAFAAELAAHMLNTDPPDHTRLRKLVNRAFTVRGVEGLRPRILEITRELLDAMESGPDEVDLLSAFAFPLPMTVICEVLGVPDDDRDDFRRWSSVLLSAAGPEEMGAAAQAMLQYLLNLIATKRANPGEDLLTALCHATEDNDRLSEPELVSMAFLLLVAGHETTVNLIGNGTLGLLRHPSELAALQADPALLPGAIEEFLRYDGPVNIATLRYTTTPLTLDEVTIPEGEFVFLSLSAANRDPARFPDAETLSVRRAPSAHLAFGHGIHYCVGAPLARMEGEVALGELLRRFPNLTLAADPGDLRYRTSPILRGLEELPVRLR